MGTPTDPAPQDRRTPEHQDDERRRRREAKYFLAAIVESSEDSIITIDLDGILTTWNKAAERLYGYPAEEAIGRPLMMLTLAEDLGQVLANTEKIRRGEAVAMFETVRVRKGGQQMILSVVLSPVKDGAGHIIGVSTIARDLTEARRAEERVKVLLRKVVSVQEEERLRISLELHDNLGQMVTALRLRAEETVQGIRKLDQELDNLARALRPATLFTLGLEVALKEHVEKWSEDTGIKAEFCASGVDGARLGNEAEMNLYRIAQEALNNAFKHAGASKAGVVVTLRDGEVVLHGRRRRERFRGGRFGGVGRQDGTGTDRDAGAGLADRRRTRD